VKPRIRALSVLVATVLGGTACTGSPEAPGMQAREPRGPSEEEIAFVAGDSDVFVIPAVGGSPRRITSGPDFDTQPDWSPDRRRLVFIRSDSPRDTGHVLIVNSDGTGLEQLTTGEPSFWDATWSPDGQRIAVTKSDFGGIHVYVMNTDGSGLRRLVEIQSGGPSWSPDGSVIAFEGNLKDREADAIYRVDVRTGETSRLIAAPQTLNQAAAWSPDGMRIAFIRIRLGTEGGQTITLGTDLFVMDADGTKLRRVASDVSVSSPAWSPGGRQILFASRGQLFTVDANGGPSRPQDDPSVQGVDPDWA
jgi:Tol biopolymer transport system component